MDQFHKSVLHHEPRDVDVGVLEDIYLKTLEALPDAVLVVNEKGHIIVFNNQAELMFGYHRTEVLGGPVENLIPEAHRRRHAAEREHYLETPRIREMGVGRVLNGLHRTGRLIPIEIKLAPLTIAGAGVHVLAVARRVTRTELATEALPEAAGAHRLVINRPETDGSES
jgi:protein-histidine pros-kinase